MDQTNPNGYSFVNEPQDYFATVIGIGELGIAVMDDMYKQGVKDLHAVVITNNQPLLAASPVPTKMLLDEQELESDDLKKEIIDGVLTALGPVFILVNDQDAISCRFALLLARCVQEKGLPCVALLAQSKSDFTSPLLHELQGLCHGVLCFDGSDPLSYPYLYRISGAIQAILKILDNSPTGADFSQAAQLLKGTYRLAIASASVDLTETADQAFNNVVAALRVEGYHGQAVERVLLLVSGYYDNLVTFSRQMDWHKQLSGLFAIDSKSANIGFHQDRWLYDSITLTLLLWMPINEAPAI
jgi:hypothetical protein